MWVLTFRLLLAKNLKPLNLTCLVAHYLACICSRYEQSISFMLIYPVETHMDHTTDVQRLDMSQHQLEESLRGSYQQLGT